MTNCLTSLGEGIASGMQMLAIALSGATPQVHPPHTHTLQAHSPQILTLQAHLRYYPNYPPNVNSMATVYLNSPYLPGQSHPHSESETPRPVFEFNGDHEGDLHSLSMELQEVIIIYFVCFNSFVQQ